MKKDGKKEGLGKAANFFFTLVLRTELSLAALLWALYVLLQMRLFVSFDDMIS